MTENDFIKINECISIVKTLQAKGIKGEIKRSVILDSGDKATISQIPVYGNLHKTIRIDIKFYN